ncbi:MULTISPECIES: hypothetical protein [Streptomyces]|nr:hypothetical protein [Streptomyces sp. DSM 41636]MDT0395247.1 hypothetical protein [Streptomyces sp. DSM 41636]
MTDVLTLQTSGISLLRPGVLAAAVRGPSRPQLTAPTFTPSERRLMDEADIVLSAAGG